MATSQPDGYSVTQIGLHWAVAVLVLVQFLAHEGMEESWDAYRDGEVPEAGELLVANFHATVGITILVLALWRLWLRFTRGAPPLPESEPAPLRFLAHATHTLLYVLIIGMPTSGAVAWFLGVEEAGDVHELAKNVLLVLVALHVAGAVAQLVLFRSNILKRMLRPGG